MARIWVLTGDKTGDNAQVLRAAGAMGLPFENRHVALLPRYEKAKPSVTPSLHHIDREKSDTLAAPWPDVVITIGRRLSLVALWIRQQSGSRTRIALFNAPKGAADQFDLIVVPAYYQVKESPRLCRIGLPLIAPDPVRIKTARAQFEATLGARPKPLHVLLLGGDMGTTRLDPAFAEAILGNMRHSFARSGSLFVSTSRRTPADVASAVERQLRPGEQIYRWSAAGEGNPLYGLFAHGDTFTVTSDSLSMLTEVARLGKPLVIAEPPPKRGIAARAKKLLGLTPVRDLGKAVEYLCAGGYAVRLGEVPHTPAAPPPDDTDRVAERLRQLARAAD